MALPSRATNTTAAAGAFLPGPSEEPLRIGCCAEIADPAWRWLADQLGPPLADWTFFLTRPRNRWEKVIKRPALARYRACRELARGACSGAFDLIVTHLPLVTCWTETFCRRRACPHLAFAFNFTSLPSGPRLALMRRAFRTLDQFVVFSSFERTLYSDYFRISPARFDVIPWRIRDPRTVARTEMVNVGSDAVRIDAAAEPPLDAICAVGSQGRDYATLLEAMRRLPHVRLILIAGAKNLDGLDFPPNVEVRQHVPLAEAESVLRRSRFVVLPLHDGRTACGHVTIVYAMFQERAIVATDSAALAEYVLPGRTGTLVPPRDSAALARAIDELWDNRDETRRLGEAGRAHAVTNCLESQTVDYVRALITRLKTTGRLQNG
jgi:glycosyltransferase involved in cell wall biosynthesis